MLTDRPLDRRLFALAVVSIVPLALMAGVGLYALQQQQRRDFERVGIELARSVANAIDAELRATGAVLLTLSTSPTLDDHDLTGFELRARRIVQSRPTWTAIVLTDIDDVRLMDTRGLTGAAQPLAVARHTLDRAAQTGQVVVDSLVREPGGSWLFPVSVPVRRQGNLYVLSALVTPDAVREVLLRQNVPDDWVISIVDAKGQRVARSRAHLENLGGRLAETVQQVVDHGGTEGVGVAYALEGERILTPYARLRSNGWTAVLGLPTAIVDAAIYRAVAFYAVGVLLSIALGAFAGIWVASTIARPIRALGRAAGAMARGERPAPPATSIREIADVGTTLRSAFDELQRSEIEREELLGKERIARQAAESSDRAKDEFLAVLSHELRTPLNAVLGWAKMLRGGQLAGDPAMIVRATDAIIRNANAQVELIDDLLDLSRITAGKLVLRVGPTALDGVLRDVVEAVRPAAEAKGITVTTSLDPEGTVIMGDPDRLQQVGWNLLMNAVKFTSNGGSVDVRLYRTGSRVQVVVRDTGRGIPAEVLPHVFERFRQADSSSMRAHGGLGLGLSLVKNLVEMHGGVVVAESEGEGRGAAFTVTFPASATRPVEEAVEGSTRAPRPTQPEHTPSVPIAGLRLLVVDDEADSLALVREILSRAGADVRTCSSADAALELFRNWRPDVLISDIEMPGQDGYALIRRVRTLAPSEGANTPAIALTAYSRAEDRRRASNAGFNLHVPKPVDPGELTALIAGLAGRSDPSL